MQRLLLILVLFIVSELNAQSALFLLIRPITSLNGMGGVGVGLSYDNIGATYFNPANGFSSYHGFSISGSGMEMKWLPGLVDDMILSHNQVSLSYRFPKLPLQLNIQQYRTFLDAGEQQYTGPNGENLGTFNTFFRADASVLAVRYFGSIWKLPYTFSYGIASKQIVQALTGDVQINGRNGRSEDHVFDRGFLLDIPFAETLKSGALVEIKPSFGISTVNIGDPVVFNDPDQADPMPTELRVGIGFSTSISLTDSWKLFEYKIGHAANDLLIKHRTSHEEPIEYQKGLGDINLIQHVFKSEASDLVQVSRGQEINLLDFYSIRFGSYVDLDGKIHSTESGISYSSKGLLNLVYHLTKLSAINAINHHIQVSYDYADWDAAYSHPLYGTHFETWNITINGLLGVRSSLQQNAKSIPLQLTNGLSFMVGANYEIPLFANGNDVDDRKSMIGYAIGVEVPWEPIRFGIALTESRSSDTLRLDFGDLSFKTGIEDIYYQLSLYSLIPISINKWLTLVGGPQIHSPFMHRKIWIEDDSASDPNYGYNYGLRGGIEVHMSESYALRINYSYWIRDLEYLLIEGYEFKPNGIQIEGRLIL